MFRNRFVSYFSLVCLTIWLAACTTTPPEKEVPEFKKMLVAYYEDRDRGIAEFMKDRCIKKF